MSLSERAQTALEWLDEHTDPPSEGAEPWRVPKRNELALNLAFVLRKAGFRSPGQRDYWQVNGAANTLSALRRRGLADNDGGGAWIQARWWITDLGRAHVRGNEPETNHETPETPVPTGDLGE